MTMHMIYTLVVVAAFAVPVSAVEPAAVDLSRIDRTILVEPRYHDAPHYALFAFGPRAEHHAWLVIDGDHVAYIDRNGNGDLTEPQERVELDIKATEEIKLGGGGPYRAMHVFPLGEVAGREFRLHLWVRNPDFDFSEDDFYRDYFREWDKNKWVHGSLYRITDDGSAAQNPLLLTATADEAQISHFDGPLTFELKWGKEQRFQPWPKESLLDVHIGTRNLLAKNCDRGGFTLSPLTTSEVPVEVSPVAEVEIPGPSADAAPAVQKITLQQRCCGNTFYAQFMLPQDVAADRIKVRLSCPSWLGREVLPAEFEVTVNRDVARDGEKVFVMFSNPELALKDAVNALRRRGLDVVITVEWLVVREDGKPALAVRLVRNDDVLEMSSRLATGTPYADNLNRCNARFEIALHDAPVVLQNPHNLNQVRAALQNLTGGIAYQTWDREIIPAP